MLKNRILSLSPDAVFFSCFTRAEARTLLELAQSRKAAERQRCAAWFAVGSRKLGNLPTLLELADVLILDPDTRWSTLCGLRGFVEDKPEDLWPLIVRWGSVHNPDIRMGVACCLLEHILQYHFDKFFVRAEQVILGGNRRFAHTLRGCNKLGQAEESENARCFDEFVASLHLRHWKQ